MVKGSSDQWKYLSATNQLLSWAILSYLIYTDVKSVACPFKDTHNYMMIAEDINGPWESPIYLNSRGGDPSLFLDPRTGRKWLLNEIWDFRLTTPNKSAGIFIREYDAKQKQLVGPIHTILQEPNTQRPKHLIFTMSMITTIC